MKKLFFSILIFVFNNVINANQISKVAVFCSADDKAPSQFKIVANNLGKELGKNNFGLVTGGAKTGLMKEVIDGYLSTSNQDNLYGVMPEVLRKYNVKHESIPTDQLLWVESMYKRLESFHQLADIIIILPGGFGTLHELMDFLVAKQFCLMNKPIILVNYEGYWDNLLKLFESMQNNKLLSNQHKTLFSVVCNEQDCLKQILTCAQIDNPGLSNYYWKADNK